MSQAHKNLLNRTLVAISKLPDALCRMFNNAQGVAVFGDRRDVIAKEGTVRVYPGDVVVRRGHVMKVGLGPGTGDLIGFIQITITEADVGRRILQFTSMEGKTHGDRMKTGQKEWDVYLKQNGGVSVEVRDPDDAVRAVHAAVASQK